MFIDLHRVPSSLFHLPSSLLPLPPSLSALTSYLLLLTSSLFPFPGPAECAERLNKVDSAGILPFVLRYRTNFAGALPILLYFAFFL